MYKSSFLGGSALGDFHILISLTPGKHHFRRVLSQNLFVPPAVIKYSRIKLRRAEICTFRSFICNYLLVLTGFLGPPEMSGPKEAAQGNPERNLESFTRSAPETKHASRAINTLAL